MNSNCVFKVLLFTVCIFILTAPNPSGLAETPFQPGQSSAGSIIPLYQQEDGEEEEPDESAPVGRSAISVSSSLVTMQVLVTDDRGNVVTGLKPENFIVYEDKVKQEISNFAPIEANITAVLLIERTKYSSYSVNDLFIEQIYNIMATFVRNLRKGDWVGVIGFDIKPTIFCDFTQDHQKVMDTFREFRFPVLRENNLFDSIIDTIDRTQEMEGKVAIILVGTGFNSFSSHTYDDVLKMCRRSNAAIYSISLGQYYRLILESYGYTDNEDSLSFHMADSHLSYISEYTGGAAYFPRNDTELPAITENISVLLRSQYSIGYISTNTKKDDKYRKIKVEIQADIMRDGKPLKFKVKTRKGYLPRP